MPTSPWPRSRSTRLLGSATVVCAVSAAASAGFAGTGSAAVPTEQTIEAAPSPVTSGTTVTFSGRLTGLADRPLAGEQVRLQWRETAEAPWHDAGTAVTDENGVAKPRHGIGVTAQWRIAYGGDEINDPASSSTVTVQARQPVGQRIVDAAAAQAGKPYAYGGSGPDTFDCSGLTRYAHNQAGVELPRSSSAQREAVPEIAKSDLRPGDLVFFHSGGSVYHTGIFAGGNKIWAAPESGDVVRLQEIWTSSYTAGRAW